jgi:hypothetical protein
LALALATASPLALADDGTTAPPPPRYTGQVTDSLRTPTHRLAANPKTGRASGDLVFVDHEHAQTTVRTCLWRRDVHWRTCFTSVTGDAGVANVTPLHFRRGSYSAHWSVDGSVVAHWRFKVV